MAYATVESFVERVSTAEAVVLSGARPPAALIEPVLQRALDDASATVDTYVAARYPTPLSPVPRTVELATIALAREALDRNGRDQVIKEADRVRAWLKDVSRGLAILAGNEADQTAPEPTPNAGGVRFTAPARVFSDERLGRFTGDC